MNPPTRILVVDEEALIGHLFSEILEPQLYTVFTAESEREAAELLVEPFDLLVLHRRLPHASCENLVRAARQHRDPVILLLSSEKSLEAERNMLLLGAAEILYKPLDPLEVRACVERNQKPQPARFEIPGGPRVLVVDDDALVLRSVQDILQDQPYTVEGTASPYQALERIRQEPFEILLSDLMMDELSGLELIRAALNWRPDMQAIVMTGYASKKTAVAALKEGVYDFLEKPLTPEVVRQTVARAWKAQRYRLENRKLLHALQKQLEEKNRLLGDLEAKTKELEQFTYTVSHDLKSPIVTIQGFLGLLKQDLDAGARERVEHDLDRIATAAQSMQRLLDELLVLSRVGRQTQAWEEAVFEDLVRDALHLPANALALRDVEVAVTSEATKVQGERQRLVELLGLLIENAARFMGAQPAPRIEIGTRRENGTPVFFVSDNGRGIASEYHERVFGLFDKLDPNSEGTGIGLTLARRIVQLHRGRIWIESEGMGQGTTLCFTLPA